MAAHAWSTSAPTRSTLRASPAEVAAILDRLDAERDPRRGLTQAFVYRNPAVRIQFSGPQALTVSAPTRWLSAERMAFLSGAFVYDNTPCQAQLITLHGMWHTVAGRSDRCQYVAPHVYEVEMVFEQSIDPSLYCMKAGSTSALLVDDQPLLAKLAMHYLRELNAEVMHVDSAKQALELLEHKPFDVVLMDIRMPEMDGATALRLLRERGYRGRVIAFTAISGADERAQLLAAGFDEHVTKPFDRDSLEKMLEWLRAEPLVSTFAEDPAMAEMIGEFVAQLPGRLRELLDALGKNDRLRLETVLGDLKACGAGMGYDVLTQRAIELESALRENLGADHIKNKIGDMIEMCRLVRAPRAPAKPAIAGDGTNAAAESAATTPSGAAAPQSTAN